MYYETVIVYAPNLSRQQVNSFYQNTVGAIESAQGQVHQREYWGLRALAYPIKKNTKGHYVAFHYTADGSVIANVERKLQIDQNVLRYLTVKVDNLPSEPSALAVSEDESKEQATKQASADKNAKSSRGAQAETQKTETQKPETQKPETQQAETPQEAKASDDKDSPNTDTVAPDSPEPDAAPSSTPDQQTQPDDTTSADTP